MADTPEPETSLESTPEATASSPVGPDRPGTVSPMAGVPTGVSSPQSVSPPPGGPSLIRRVLARLNIYLLLFILLLIIAGGVIVLTLRSGKNNGGPDNNKSVSSLTDSQIAALNGATTVVGSSKQTLDVQSDSIFEGQILARSNLDVAGSLKVGGGLNLPSLNVSGQTSLNAAQVGGDLKVAGAADIQGQLTLHKGLSVAGTTSFGNLSAGTLSVTSLQLSGDLGLNRHIVTSGNATGKSSGSALGSGGTASVSGNDTAGTVNINTGTSPSAGIFINVSFAHAFSGTPHVIITPVGSTAGSINYYVTRSSGGFSIGDSSVPPAHASFAFDYLVVQ